MRRASLPFVVVVVVGASAALLTACQDGCVQSLAIPAYTTVDGAVRTLDVEPAHRVRAADRDCAELPISHETVTICRHRDDAARDQAVAELRLDGTAVEGVDVLLTVAGTDTDTVDRVVADLLRTPGSRC